MIISLSIYILDYELFFENWNACVTHLSTLDPNCLIISPARTSILILPASGGESKGTSDLSVSSYIIPQHYYLSRILAEKSPLLQIVWRLWKVQRIITNSQKVVTIEEEGAMSTLPHRCNQVGAWDYCVKSHGEREGLRCWTLATHYQRLWVTWNWSIFDQVEDQPVILQPAKLTSLFVFIPEAKIAPRMK